MKQIDRLDSIIGADKQGSGRHEVHGRRTLRAASPTLVTESGGRKAETYPHFVRHEARLDMPYSGYTFTDEDKQALKQTSNLGKLVNVADSKTGEMRLTIFSENINAHLSYLNY